MTRLLVVRQCGLNMRSVYMSVELWRISFHKHTRILHVDGQMRSISKLSASRLLVYASALTAQITAAK